PGRPERPLRRGAVVAPPRGPDPRDGPATDANRPARPRRRAPALRGGPFALAAADDRRLDPRYPVLDAPHPGVGQAALRGLTRSARQHRGQRLPGAGIGLPRPETRPTVLG